ncbi:uncharacterized protein LOC133201229 [Saccostrea echinata]|uniref:uncharacterized protein LOC133201229 n=1 Tax=Saccostrea echinata TaxID=191078 RepID=UPI002A7F6391|nr:uncharacterized protein LOC133201229 [Saccostrea echinata]
MNDQEVYLSSFVVAFEWSGSEDGISGTEDIHRECIQENLPQMSHSMDLKRVVLLDELIENGCLTENEAADIRDCEKRKDRTRKLAIIMGKRSREKFSSFLEVLKRAENYPHVAEQLENSYKAKIEEGRRKRECVLCYIIRNVNIRHIIDTLCSQFVVSLEFLDEVISCEANDAEKMQRYWKRLFEQMNTSVYASRHRKAFKESLREKYEHIAKKISVKNQIKCRCNATETNRVIRVESMSWPSGSLTTEGKSTTSTAARPKSHLSAVSTISENVSDISNDGYAGNIPRTVEWVSNLEVEVESTENNFTSIQRAQPSYSEIVKTQSGVGDALCSSMLQDQNTSLLAIGDDLLLQAGINESMKEKYNQHLTSFVVSSKDDKHLLVNQTETERKETKSSKKKRKKRKRAQSEPSPTLPTDEYKINISQRLSLSQDSTKSERTIVHHLFDNIPTIGITDDSSEKLGLETSLEQWPLESPKVLTSPRQITPLVKVGCSDKGKNDKCKKKKKTNL